MPPPLGFNFNRGVNYVPCIVTDNRGRGVPAQYTRVIMGPDPHVIGIIPGDNSQYGGPLYVVPDHNQGDCPRYVQDDSGDSSTELMTLIDSNLPSNTSATCRSPLRPCATAKPLASSSNTRKKYAKSRSVCGKLASSKTLVGVGLKGPMLCIGLKRHWWTWTAGRGCVTGTRGVRNVGIPSEKGVMLWNNV